MAFINPKHGNGVSADRTRICRVAAVLLVLGKKHSLDSSRFLSPVFFFLFNGQSMVRTCFSAVRGSGHGILAASQ